MGLLGSFNVTISQEPRVNDTSDGAPITKSDMIASKATWYG